LTLPDGVKAEELTCKYEDGVVTLEAPYVKPALEGGESRDVQVQHQQAEPLRKEIPIRRESAEDKREQETGQEQRSA